MKLPRPFSKFRRTWFLVRTNGARRRFVYQVVNRFQPQTIVLAQPTYLLEGNCTRFIFCFSYNTAILPTHWCFPSLTARAHTHTKYKQNTITPNTTVPLEVGRVAYIVLLKTTHNMAGKTSDLSGCRVCRNKDAVFTKNTGSPELKKKF